MASELYTLRLTPDQFELVRIFVQYHDMDIDDVVVDVKEDTSNEGQGAEGGDAGQNLEEQEAHDPDPVEVHQACQEDILQDEEYRDGECRECFCVPCVTNYPQRWLGPGQAANPRKPEQNSGLRKKIYKKYWKVLKDRYVWMDRRYQNRRARMIKEVRDRGEEPVRVEREIIPDCVLEQVRGLYPNPPDMPYMGHMWW